MLLLLAACGGGLGEDGCQPQTVKDSCTIWLCWEVNDDGEVTYRYYWGWDEQDGEPEIEGQPCDSPQACADRYEQAVEQGCGGQS